VSLKGNVGQKTLKDKNIHEYGIFLLGLRVKYNLNPQTPKESHQMEFCSSNQYEQAR
jgi:hypothetical protein